MPLTLEELITGLLPRFATKHHIPRWPPDVFAICAKLLICSQTYTQVLTDWPPALYEQDDQVGGWAGGARTLASAWRTSVVREEPLPLRLISCWEVVLSARKDSLEVLKTNHALWQAVLELLAIADEVCQNAGFLPLDQDYSDDLHFSTLLWIRLLKTDEPVTLTDEIEGSRARVLPKIHTPKTGLTIRSLSHYLAFDSSGEINGAWPSVSPYWKKAEGLNLLVVPWPKLVTPSQFRRVNPDPKEMRTMPVDEFGFFTFEGAKHNEVCNHVFDLVRVSKAEVGRIDGIVLPETALTPYDRTQLAKRLKDEFTEDKIFVVGGYGSCASDGVPGENMVCLDFPDSAPMSQDKHHRWQLTESQIDQYGIATSLHPDKSWWEYISLKDRKLTFVALNSQLVLCALICEDLARPDPVGDMLRAVGPSLIIALLMDGPQLANRWSSRHATVLAEDPGSSVLAVTSRGMAKLSRPRTGTARSGVVALWKDSESDAVEIDLAPEMDAFVLILSCRRSKEWTADGRSDVRQQARLQLTGVHQIQATGTIRARDPDILNEDEKHENVHGS